MLVHCAVPENIHSKGIGISWRWRGSLRLKHLKNCIKLNWNFQRGGGEEVFQKNPFHRGGIDIFWKYRLHSYPLYLIHQYLFTHLGEEMQCQNKVS